MQHLANNLHFAIPNNYKHQLQVPWDKTQVSEEWLISFWKFVQCHGGQHIKQFDDWPLIPATNGTLHSVSSAKNVIHHSDNSLTQVLLKAGCFILDISALPTGADFPTVLCSKDDNASGLCAALRAVNAQNCIFSEEEAIVSCVVLVLILCGGSK